MGLVQVECIRRIAWKRLLSTLEQPVMRCPGFTLCFRMGQLVPLQLGALLASLLKTHHLHRGMWRAHYKPHGWEVIESRYGTLRARLEGVGDLILSLLEGRIGAIEELEQPPGSPANAKPPRVYNAEIYQLPLMCWARAVTPAMPSIKSDSACPL